MNLKEAFRYQNFLDNIFRTASMNIQMKSHCLKVTRNHKCKDANPDASDFIEEVTTEEEYFNNDDVIMLMELLIDQKHKLTEAISIAKSSIGFDIDAAVATNKYRQELNNSIKTMLRYRPSNRVETAVGHKFNVEGNQVEYKYNVEVSSEESYNKENAKKVMRDIIAASDITSTEIDAAKINTSVDYTPIFDVNDTFDDVMNAFISSQDK